MKKAILVVLLLIGWLMMLASCGSSDPAPTPTSQTADLVLKNGAIFTMDSNRSQVTALAVSGGKILFVGTDAGVAAFEGPQTRVIDLQGQMVLPGLHDSHVHIVDGGLGSLQCNLLGLNTVPKVLEKVVAYGQENPELSWIIGAGWEAALFPPEGPTHDILDAVLPDRPVLLLDADLHSAWLNAKALELAKITKDTPDPPNGRIERDASGEPTGTLRELAVDLATAAAPPTTPKQFADGLRAGQKVALSNGITSVFEAFATPSILQTYKELADSGELKLRTLASLETKPLEGPEQVARLVDQRARFRGPRLRPDAAKVFLDGVIESQTAALLEPYVGTDETGPLFTPPDQVNALFKALNDAGFTIHVHAIGDRAVRVALDAVEALGGTDLRPSLSHIELTDPSDLPRFAQLGCVANMQARWAVRDASIQDLVEPALGPERSQHLFTFASMRRAGAVLAGGSDYPVSPISPLEGIQVAVTRLPLSGQGDVWLPNERLTLEEALEAYTINGAYANLQEDVTGSLEVGKLADMVVLEKNLFQIPPTQISQVRVMRTFIEGEEVYTAP